MKKTCKNCNHFLHCVRVYNLYSCCNDYEAKPLTNEEWFNELSTEEKAKWLTNHSKFIYECGQKQVAPKTMYEEDWERNRGAFNNQGTERKRFAKSMETILEDTK